jgi:hypothetical protein
MKRKQRRIFLVVLIFIVLAVSYYLVEYSYKKELKKINEVSKSQTNELLSNKSPDEVIYELNQKIDSISSFIRSQKKIIPYYPSSVEAYDKILRKINLFENRLDINIDKISSEEKNHLRIDRFKISGNGKFRDLFSLMNLFESSPEIYKLHLKEINQTFAPNEKGKLDEKVVFTFNLENIYTTSPEFNLDTLLSRKDEAFLTYISDFFTSLIKLDIPPNDEGLFEVEGAKLIAIMPDAVYLLDKKGNSYTLAEGDEVYLGYLTKINYDKHSCEFLLNKGGILEKITLVLEDKEAKK